MIYKSLLTVLFTSTIYITAEQNPAFNAIAQHNTPALEQILQESSSSTQTNEHGQTILHAAVLTSNAQAIEIILQSKCIEINQLDNYGKTAMDYAVEYGYNKIVRKLYKNKGKVTSAENARYAQILISDPFKKLLAAIGITLVISLVVVVGGIIFGACIQSIKLAWFLGVCVGQVLIYTLIPLDLILLGVGIGGLSYRSNTNLILSKIL